MHNSEWNLQKLDNGNQPSKNHNRDFKVFANALPEYFSKKGETRHNLQFDVRAVRFGMLKV